MRVNFFAKEPLEQLKYEQYTSIDIKILNELCSQVKISNSLSNLHWDVDFYYSWWATGSIIPLIVGLIRRKPVFVVVGGNEALLTRDSISGQYFGYGAFSFFKKLAVKFVLAKCTRVIAVSNFSKLELEKVTSSDIEVIPNAVDLELFDNQFKNVSLLNTEVKFITVCRLDCKPVQIKRLDNLITAFSEIANSVPNASLSIVGAFGNDYKRLLQLTIDLNVHDKISFVGMVPNLDMPKLLLEHNCYIQLSDVETFGVAVVEAAALLLPLILSRRGALPEVTSDMAMFVDHNDVHDIARALRNFSEGSYPFELSNRRKLRQYISSRYSYESRKDRLAELFKRTFNDD